MFLSRELPSQELWMAEQTEYGKQANFAMQWEVEQARAFFRALCKKVFLE